jgi:tellurite resistance protein
MKLRTATVLRMRDTLLQSGRRPSTVVSTAFETLARQGLLGQEEATALTRIEPLAEVMFLMMSADDQVTDHERDVVRGAVRGMSDGLIRSGTIKVMLENFEVRLREHGRDERLREIADELQDEPREAEGAFALAAAVALADDEVADAENAFINQLAEWFGIGNARAMEILDELEADRATPELVEDSARS